MTFTVRPAAPTDAEQVSRVYIAAWEAVFRSILPETEYPRDALLAKGRTAVTAHACLVAEHDGTVVCFATGDPSTGLLDMMYADPFIWRTGTAGKLLTAITSIISNKGCTPWLICWTENHHAIRFYTKHGWVTDGDVKTRLVGIHGTLVSYQRMVHS